MYSEAVPKVIWKQWEWYLARIHLRRKDVSVAMVVIFLGSQFLLKALRLVLSTMLCWFKPVSRFNLCLGSDEYSKDLISTLEGMRPAN